MHTLNMFVFIPRTHMPDISTTIDLLDDTGRVSCNLQTQPANSHEITIPAKIHNTTASTLKGTSQHPKRQRLEERVKAAAAASSYVHYQAPREKGILFRVKAQLKNR
uniref:Uncharacterized protein n=1 Tax=Oryza punctata TaxID=4537 RepID=A0A0E0JSY1_ORYPU